MNRPDRNVTESPARPGHPGRPKGTRRQTSLAAAGLLVVTALVLFWPALFGGRTLFGRDITPFFYPMKHVLVEAVRSGRIPLWNPGLVGGEPFFATLQPGVLYPGSLLLYLLPLSISFDWLVALHYPVAGSGLYLLLRRWGRSAPAAWAGAVSFMLGGVLVSLGNFPNNLQTVAWTPWLFWSWDRALERPETRRLATFATFCAVAFLGGEPQMLGLSLAWLFLHGLLRIENRPTGLLRQATWFGAAGVIALLVVAVQLVPFIEYVLRSVRTMPVDLSFAAALSLEGPGLAHLLVPPVLDEGVYGFTTRFIAASRTPWILSPYVGAISLGLALVGAAAAGRRRAWFWTGSAVLGILLALGVHSPVYRFLFDVIPVLRPFRYPEKFLLLAALATGVMVAFGTDAAMDPLRRRGAALLLGAMTIGYAAGAAVLSFAPGAFASICGGGLADSGLCSDPDLTAHLYAGVALRLSVLVALAALATSVGGKGRLRREAVGGLLAMLIAADLLAAHAAVNPTVEAEVYERPAWPARALDDLGADPGAHRFRGSPHTAVMGSAVAVPGAWELTNLYLDFETMGPNVGQLAGYLHQDGLQGVEMRSVAMTNDAAVHGWASDPVRYLRAMNVRWYADPTAAADSLTGLRVIARHPELPLRLFEVPDPLPRAYLVSEWELARSAPAALRRTLSEGFPLGSSVVLEQAPDPDPAPGSGRILESDYDLNRIRLHARTDAPMLLVINDRFYPGWIATVNGADAPVLRAGGVFRAVPLPPGDSRIELRFRPRGLGPSVLASLAGLVLLAFGFRRGPHGEAPEGSDAGVPG